MVKATWNGHVIADSDDTVVVEGNHYFPEDRVRTGFLVPSPHHTTCAWKGQASYYHVVVDGQRNENAAWYYPEPSAAAIEAGCQDRIAFWHGVKVR